MVRFTNSRITLADASDVAAIKMLLDRASRGESSRRGWTTEADLIDGDVRADEASVREAFELDGSVFLKYVDESGELIGCANLARHDDRIYFGMFSVKPDRQTGGIGTQIMQGAEEYASSVGCRAMYMTVISARDDLLRWYERRGYRDTGERVPFAEDGIHGRHLRELEFAVLEKAMSPA